VERQRVADALVRATVEADARAWMARNRPDHLDVLWSRWLDMTRLVESAPFPTSHPRHGSLPLRTVRKGSPFQPTASPSNDGTERFSW
jgi:hypothetical protein